MLNEASTVARGSVSFGPFRLVATERLLERAGVPVPVGARALDILIALIERAGEVVHKRELIKRVWPDVTVDDRSLRVHMSALRKALGDGDANVRYVATVAGRGYCFVAAVARSDAMPLDISLPSSDQIYRLPPRLVRMVGRDGAIYRIIDQLSANRFVTVFGAGGMGKTSVAVAVGHELFERFEGAVHFLDLGPLNDPLLVPSALASMLGLPVRSNDPIPSLLAFLRDKRVLLVLDSCEHVIGGASALAERIFQEVPSAHILATSREVLRVEGEQVYRLEPLGCPPEFDGLTAPEALAFPAVQLFVERVAATGIPYKLTDFDAPIVGDICRRLDGMALAIELAAGRVEAYGIEEMARLLDSQFRLRWSGRRTAVPRHQTLSATLDWSYDLLPEFERLILRRLSVFVGYFSLEAARSVAACDDLDAALVLDALASLVAKSLASIRAGGGVIRYRLLDTTRAYVLVKLIDSGEGEKVAHHHARYFVEYLERRNASTASLKRNEAFIVYGDHVGNVRAALEWSFGPRGDLEIGTALAATSVRVFMQLSLLTECHRWTERAIGMLDEQNRGTRRELELQASLGQCLMFTKSNSDEVRVAFHRALALAEQLESLEYQLELLGGLHLFHERTGDFATSLAFAERSAAVAARLGDPTAIAAASSFVGISYQLIGEQAVARRHLEAALPPLVADKRGSALHFGFDHPNRAAIALARTLWLLGLPDQAVTVARQTIAEAATMDHPVTLCMALIWGTSVFIWAGDLPSADATIDRFIAHAERHSLAPYFAVGQGIKADIAIRRGDPAFGLRTLPGCLARVHVDRYELHATFLVAALAEGQAMVGEVASALAIIDEAIANAERTSDLLFMPELLRLKGDITAALPVPDTATAEQYFLRSIDLAKSQSALSWQLRAATSLARLLSSLGRRTEAISVLADVHGAFTEGFNTADLQKARQLLADLHHLSA